MRGAERRERVGGSGRQDMRRNVDTESGDGDAGLGRRESVKKGEEGGADVHMTVNHRGKELQ
jgi:hypothetical protein